MNSHPDDHSPGSPLLPVLPDFSDSAIADPPPPYPDPQRRHHRTSRSLRGASGHRRVHSHPSETQLDSDTLLSSFSEEDDDGETTETTPFLCDGHRYQLRDGSVGVDDAHSTFSSISSASGWQDSFKFAGWKRYFAPLTRRVYHKALFHLLILNFPYALIAWIYLFVFTVTGTTTLIALPLGAILCFLDLLGARVFSRGELYLQTRFHQVHLPSYQSRPLFTRLREPAVGDHENGRAPCNPADATTFRLVQEHSFYKNTYAMFTDPTTYQALFYFLVIKPAITLLITIILIALGIPSMILILPAPVVLRAVRKVGLWQANIAIEGLYHAVR